MGSRTPSPIPADETRQLQSAEGPGLTEEQYALFRDYLDSRHADGGMADMDVFEKAGVKWWMKGFANELPISVTMAPINWGPVSEANLRAVNYVIYDKIVQIMDKARNAEYPNISIAKLRS